MCPLRRTKCELFVITAFTCVGKSQEFTEEYVDVYRVKFAPDLAEQRTKSPHLFKDPERVHQMKTSTLERGGRPSSSTGRTSSAARSAPGSPGPLGLPYPQPYDFRRTSGPLWENESIMMYGRGMSDTERSDTLSPLKEREMSLGNPLYAKPNRRRIIHTPDSLEDDIVVADVRKVTPEVGGLEFWTTSGGSTSGIEEERVAIREWNIEVKFLITAANYIFWAARPSYQHQKQCCLNVLRTEKTVKGSGRPTDGGGK